MSDHAHAAHADHGDAAAHEAHYKKIYFLLLGLLVISFVGPWLGIRAVTLITAFGIAVYKAWLVAKHFMHLTVQPRYVVYMLATTLVFMLLLYAGAAPDVMEHEGTHWAKVEPDAGQPPRVLHPESGEHH